MSFADILREKALEKPTCEKRKIVDVVKNLHQDLCVFFVGVTMYHTYGEIDAVEKDGKNTKIIKVRPNNINPDGQILELNSFLPNKQSPDFDKHVFAHGQIKVKCENKRKIVTRSQDPLDNYQTYVQYDDCYRKIDVYICDKSYENDLKMYLIKQHQITTLAGQFNDAHRPK